MQDGLMKIVEKQLKQRMKQEKSIIRDIRTNKEEYIRRINEVRKIYRDKKREMITNEIK